MLKHIHLSIIAFTLTVVSCNSAAQEKLNPNAFQAKAKELKDEIIIDVRTPGEYTDGHVEGAININWHSKDFKNEVSKLDKSKPIMVYCLAGGRSGSAANSLRKMGFQQVYDLKGGMNNWRIAGLKEVTNDKAQSKAGLSMNEYHHLVNNSDLALVDFYAPWCTPCKKMSPFLKEIDEADEHLKLIKINADKNVTVVTQLNVNQLPTLLLYKKNKLVWQHTGYISKNSLLEKIIKFK